MKAEDRRRIRSMSLVLIILYGAIIIYFTLFSDRLGRLDPYGTYRYNLVPFTEIRRYIMYRHKVSFMAFFINIFGNILVFMPWGFLIPIWMPNRSKWYQIILYSFTFTMCIELMQLVTHVGVFDVDDIIMNTIGGLAGFACYHILNYIRIYRRKQRS